METDSSYLGSVIQAAGSTLTVALSEELPSSSPIVDGRMYRIGEVGSFIRFPLGFLDVYGVVTRVGSNLVSSTESKDQIASSVRRWIEVQLVGEAIHGDKFQRGVGSFPTIDDEAHLVTHEYLRTIYQENEKQCLEIGSLATSDVLKVHLDLDKLVCRHSAILGATGSGKSNTVASLVSSLSGPEYPNAQIIIIDTHGEYSELLAGKSKVFSIDGTANKLQLPYWALSFREFAWIFLDRKDGDETQAEAAIRNMILQKKFDLASKLACGPLSTELVTSESPIPFDLGQIWYDCYVEDNAVIEDRSDPSTLVYVKDKAGKELKGSANKFELPLFERPGIGSKSPFMLSQIRNYGSLPNKILSKAKDKRFGFLMETDVDGVTRDLDSIVSDWIGHDKPVTILDLAGIPSEITDIVVGLITQLIYEVMVWGRNLPGIGRQRPLMFVFEEAHAYLPRGQRENVSGYAARGIRKILKEGRKYGMGAMIVSQRPSELDDTVLSQCGTFISLRLSNPSDQGQVKASIPDSMSGLMDLLPALRTGEAIVTGEAIRVPSRVSFPKIEARSASSDPPVSDAWKKKPRQNSIDYKQAISNWRQQSIVKQTKSTDEQNPN